MEIPKKNGDYVRFILQTKLETKIIWEELSADEDEKTERKKFEDFIQEFANIMNNDIANSILQCVPLINEGERKAENLFKNMEKMQNVN